MLRVVASLTLCLSFGSCDASTQGDVAPSSRVGDADDVAPTVGDEPLTGGLASLDELGHAVVAALNARDAEALVALAIDEAEYTGRLFPAIATHPGAESMGRDLLWDMHIRQSRDDMQRALGRHGGANLSFVRFEPRRTVRRAGVTFHERPHLVVRGEDGAEHTLQILASLVEHESTQTFKLLGFRDHD
ncbi:hypothetical protein [Nannocystis radixulma]|uniref:DUF4440 domain-containing protein n=1 Tax=Nannocystis radixulma TaxID=2995305 RepID=A0ABT5BCA9_9BACT|nr:hypothetical protein [Nannocystis radixulma]MDC0671358.1 hypothetical protein [Nannocystis radixulma]